MKKYKLKQLSMHFVGIAWSTIIGKAFFYLYPYLCSPSAANPVFAAEIGHSIHGSVPWS